jgi:hypothetical protein
MTSGQNTTFGMLYYRSYLHAKGVKLKHTDVLAGMVLDSTNGKLLIRAGLNYEFELIHGIIVKLGQLHFAYDTIVALHFGGTKHADYRGVEYHLDYFFIITKSIFDFVAHLANRVLDLGYRGKNVDLSRADFRNEVLKESSSLGTLLNSNQSWIDQITRLRTAIEHNKIVPVLHVGNVPPTTSSKLHFPTEALSFTELLASSSKKKPQFKEVIEFCEDSLQTTQEIVEEVFGITVLHLLKRQTIKPH